MIDFQALFARSPNPYVVLDSSLVIVWMNEAYLRATMRTREAITGLKMFEAFPSEPGSESHELLSSSLHRVLLTGQADELALIRYDIIGVDGQLEQRFWSATHTPLCDDAGQVRFILQHTVDVTELQDLRRMRDEAGVIQRANAVQAYNVNLQAETDRMRTLFEQAPGFMAVLEGQAHTFQLANAAYRKLVGGREVLGKPALEAVPELDEQGLIARLDQVRGSGVPYVGRSERVVLLHNSDQASAERFLDFIFQPILGEGGDVEGVFVQGHDVTEEAVLLRRQELLINELNHRVKNTLAIVQGLAAQSFRAVDTTGTARRTFDARLKALAAAHDLLTEGKWEPTSLAGTIRASVEAATGADAERVQASGPSVSLAPEQAVALAMAIHELSTNAIKYGALSNASGQVTIDWQFTAERADGGPLVIAWVEQGGPPVTAPTRRGFGTRLIERGLSADMDGHASIEWTSSGLQSRFTLNVAPGA